MTAEVDLTNAADATQPATFRIFVDGQVVEVITLDPGDSDTASVDLSAFEDQTVNVTVRSGGVVIASRAVTVDCAPPPAGVDITAGLACQGRVAHGTATVVNEGGTDVVVRVEVNGDVVVPNTTVVGGATSNFDVDLSDFEDQDITAVVFVDGTGAATFGPVAVDCVPPVPAPEASIGGVTCSPAAATVTLINSGEPGSQVTFRIFVNGVFVQDATVFGGESTTIVGDLSNFEDERLTIGVRARGKLVARETLVPDCDKPLEPPGSPSPSASPGSPLPSGPGGSPPPVGSGGVSGTGGGPLASTGTAIVGLLSVALGLLVVGLLLLARGRRTGRHAHRG